MPGRSSGYHAIRTVPFGGMLTTSSIDRHAGFWPLTARTSKKSARRLTANLFRHVAAGGRLLLANFAPSLPDIGYLETCMDWRLIYRDEADLAAMIDEIPFDAIRDVRTYRDSSGHIVFIAVDRR
jgi:hypothetical protein